MAEITAETMAKIRAAVQSQRLLDTAVRLIEIPSPTRSAAAVSDCLEALLGEDGFEVERVAAGWPTAPAVVARLESGLAGKTLQFNGHLDTVHLPFVPPRVADGMLFGSGASDMKGGIAAAVEAMRALRDAQALPAGNVLLTAHDLHETPWGDGSQLNGLIEAGYLGDGVLLPEYLSDRLPVVGRGLAVITVTITRPGEPVHEVLGGIDEPSVIEAGAEVIHRFAGLDEQLSAITHLMAGRESIFVGQVAAGEIFNQAPVKFVLSGTRRWLPTSRVEEVEAQFHDVLAEVADECNVQIEGRFQMARDAFQIKKSDPLVGAFQAAYQAIAGHELAIGAKPFVDDGNAFVRLGGVPAITHGPDAKGAHTLDEEVAVDELARVALVYALAAVQFCPSKTTK